MIILLVVIALIVVYAIFTFNRLVALRQAWKRAFADIDVQLKQRHDLIPNLVETVKGYAAHESGVFTQVAEARANAMRATSVGEKSAAEGVLSGALGNLMAVAENYPAAQGEPEFPAIAGRACRSREQDRRGAALPEQCGRRIQCRDPALPGRAVRRSDGLPARADVRTRRAEKSGN